MFSFLSAATSADCQRLGALCVLLEFSMGKEIILIQKQPSLFGIGRDVVKCASKFNFFLHHSLVAHIALQSVTCPIRLLNVILRALEQESNNIGLKYASHTKKLLRLSQTMSV